MEEKSQATVEISDYEKSLIIKMRKTNKQDKKDLETLEKRLEKDLPNPEKIETLEEAKRIITSLNREIKSTKVKLLTTTQNFNILNTYHTMVEKNLEENIQAQKQTARDLGLRVIEQSKRDISYAAESFNLSMGNFSFGMKEYMSDNDTIQKLLIPLVRIYPFLDFSCSKQKVYICLQPKEDYPGALEKRGLRKLKFLSEWGYGLEICMSDKDINAPPDTEPTFTIKTDPEDLLLVNGRYKELHAELSNTTYTTLDDIQAVINTVLDLVHNTMLEWIVANLEASDETYAEKAKEFLA